MTVYIYAEAMSSPDEYIDVFETKVFKTLDEALAYKNEQKEMFLNDDEDEWSVDFGDEPDAYSTHLTCDNDEAILTVSASEI